MARSLLVWGLNQKDWSHEKRVMASHGRPEFYEDFNEAWCTVCFPSRRAANACAASLQQGFAHLSVCVEPLWQFGKTKATATADLIRVAEWLGCREELHVFPVPKVFRLTQGADAVLAAVKVAGGAHALAAGDPAAAMCLCHGFMQRPGTRCSAEKVFAVLGPDMLRVAAADVGSCQPGSPQRACTAMWLAACFLQHTTKGDLSMQQAQTLKAVRQDISSSCMEVMQAVVDALSDCSAMLTRAVQQRNAQQQDAVSQVHFASGWLLSAADGLLHCMAEFDLCCMVDERLLLDTFGQFLRKVIVFVQLVERADAAGLWPWKSPGLTAAGCVGRLHRAIAQQTVGKGARSAAGMPALHAVVLRALRTILDYPAAPRHLYLLLYLLQLARITRPGDICHKDNCALLSQLARVQQLAITWYLSSPLDIPLQDIANALCDFKLIPSLEDQVALLMDVTVLELAETVMRVLDSANAAGTMNTDCIFETGAVAALAAALQASPCNNVRGLAPNLARQAIGCCLAAGLFQAALALQKAMEPVEAAAKHEKPWAAGDAIAALVRGGLSCSQLAHAEAAAQQALPCTSPLAAQLDRRAPHKILSAGARILMSVTWCLTPRVTRTLAHHRLVGPLLEALPWQANWSDTEHDMVLWEVTVHGTGAITEILGNILVFDKPANAVVLRDGSWDAATQRVRALQPPPVLAAQWARELGLLHSLTAMLNGSGRSSHQTTHKGKADADAIAAAERAMQELLADEQPTEALSQRSKAAAKRARKKASKQQTEASANTAQVVVTAPAPAAVTSGANQAAVASYTTVPDADAQQAKASQVAAAESEWFRCPLSGKVLRDPVLCGSSGHSFERAALEQWLAANPGVDPLSKQPLPPEGSSVVPNYALRNLVEQLYPG